MRIINAESKYLNANDVSPYQFMEKAGRTCYKSEDKITAESSIKFVQRLLNSGHTAMLEHSHIILNMSEKPIKKIETILNELSINTDTSELSATSLRNYFNITITDTECYLSGSFRSFINLFKYAPHDEEVLIGLYAILNNSYPELFPQESDILPAFEIRATIKSRSEFVADVNALFDEATAKNIIMKHLVHTVQFTCDRGVSHEFVRHRPASFAQESTRYCNYAQDKFNNEITVIRPCFWNEENVINDISGNLLNRYMAWQSACEFAESQYFKLLESDATPQEARDVLPTSVKTEIIITATENEWQHMINLRYHGTTGKPHPQMIESMTLIYDELCKQSDNRLA